MGENSQRAPFQDIGIEEGDRVGRGGKPGATARGHSCRPAGWHSRGALIHPDREGTAGDNAEGEDTFAE